MEKTKIPVGFDTTTRELIYKKIEFDNPYTVGCDKVKHFDEYQLAAACTAMYQNQGENLEYVTLGLCGEAGEVANKVKKIQRDHNNVLTEDMRKDLIDECGDTMWYLAMLCTELDIDMSEVATKNISKLHCRFDRGKIKGRGDKR